MIITDARVEEALEPFDGSSEKTLRDTKERVMVHMTFYNYIVHLAKSSDEIELVVEDDFVNPRWFPLDELVEIELSEPTKQSLLKLGLLPE